MSVQNVLERMSRGSEVVKPIWLLMMMWTVPPVVATGLGQARVSWFTPWPPAAALCTSTGSTLFALGVATAVHTGTHRAFHHGVHDFQVRMG